MKKNACKNVYLGFFSYLNNTWLGCFLWVHGRAWYPLLPFEWPPRVWHMYWINKSYMKYTPCHWELQGGASSQLDVVFSGITGGGQSAPQRLLTGKFLLTYWDKRGNEKRENGMGENWEEKKENCKREGGKLEMEVGKVIKRGEDLFFCFCFCFLFLFFVLFCFFAFHFWKRQKLVLGLLKWEFSTGKKAFHAGKKNQEKWLCSLRKICLLRPWWCSHTWATVHILEQLQEHCINRGLLVREHRMCWTWFGDIFRGATCIQRWIWCLYRGVQVYPFILISAVSKYPKHVSQFQGTRWLEKNDPLA